MLTGKMVRVRHGRDNRVQPSYLDLSEERWTEVSERLLDIFRGREGLTRGEIESEWEDAFGDEVNNLVHQGLAKLLFDRCEFEVEAGLPPDQLRDAVFAAATEQRRAAAAVPGHRPHFDRDAVLRRVAEQLATTSEAVERGLFADLKSEQRLVSFKDISPERLLQRYNVALAQAVLLRAVRLTVDVRKEPPQRIRALLRLAKFHRLVCEVRKTDAESIQLQLDGPLSLFTATQKYGLQLALFLPAVLHCRDFELRAELRWGAERRPKVLHLTHKDGLRSHTPDTGTYVPPELAMFVELFRKKVDDWEIAEETEIFPLGNGFWVPDYRLVHKASKKEVMLEVLGYWRKASAEAHLGRLAQHAPRPFVLALSDQLHLDEGQVEGLPGVHRFRNMPLPDEVVKLANETLNLPAVEDAAPRKRAGRRRKADA
jgi:uncharacterized protein